jgi:putative FmdB family regulatory protein
MPIYEYACKSCGQHLEVSQSFKDESLTTCPACGGALRKVFGSIGISFKGTGFYRTDTRSAGARGDKGEKPEKADKGEKSEKAEKSDKAKTDTASTKASEKSSGSDSGSGGKDSSTPKPKVASA